jgi:dTDP-4-amino-4,6-dideoxygalactose transaminase
VITVDFAGQPCDFAGIAEIARRDGAVIIEDASHAIGGTFQQNGQVYKIGRHPWSDMTVFSFHPVKTITTGEGGALVTDNDEYADLARCLRNHGNIRDRKSFVGLGGANDEFGPWYYEMHDPGYNYRITDFQCALGYAQLQKLPAFVARRADIVGQYNKGFANLPDVIIPYGSEWAQPSWHLYVLQFDFEKLGRLRTEVMQDLRARGIGTQVHYIPVHLQPFYRRTYGYGPGKCPVAESYYRNCLSLPLYPAMSDADVTRVIEAVRAIVSR